MMTRLLAVLVFVACAVPLSLGGQGSLRVARTLDAWAHGQAQAAPFVCPYQTRTGRPCPGCGGTHAFDLAARGRFASAAQANPLGALAGLAAWMLLATAGLVVVTGRGGWLARALAAAGVGLPLGAAVGLVIWWLST